MGGNLEDLPLPEELRKILRSWGIERLYPPQMAVVERGLISRGNFVLASPTASGKTLAAELAMISSLLKGGKVLYAVPLRALAAEKLNSFGKRYGSLGFSVRMTIGDFDSSEEPLGWDDLIILTYEKLDSIIRHGASWLSSISCAVFDEIHYVGDPYRGPTIEMTVAKFLDVNRSSRVIALSATIANLDQVAEWLRAVPIAVDWRPVPLEICTYSQGFLFCGGGSREIERETGVDDLDVVLETLRSGGQALVFYPTRRGAVAGAKRFSKLISSRGIPLDSEFLRELARDLLDSEPPSHLIEELAAVIRGGSAFHHAGLSHGARVAVEEAFRSGKLLVIAATPTLAAGVNLPARTVVVKSHKRYDSRAGRSTSMSVMEFLQMAGRAGRPGYDDLGRAVLLAKSTIEALDLLETYKPANLEPITSNLNDPTMVRFHLLSVLAMKSPTTWDDVMETWSKTLIFIQASINDIYSNLRESADFLAEAGFIKEAGGNIWATRIGERVSELYIDPVSALLLLKAVDKMSAGAAEEMAILQVISILPDMPRPSIGRRDLDLLAEVDASLSPLIPPDDLPLGLASDYPRSLKTAVILSMWIGEASERELEERLRVEPGDVRRYAEIASWLAYAASELARLRGGTKIGATKFFRELSVRLKYGVRPELIPLISIRGIGRRRARTLYRAGFTDLRTLASTEPGRLESLPGIGPKLAKDIVLYARSRIGGSGYASPPD